MDKIKITRRDLTGEELTDTADILVARTNALWDLETENDDLRRRLADAERERDASREREVRLWEACEAVVKCVDGASEIWSDEHDEYKLAKAALAAAGEPNAADRPAALEWTSEPPQTPGIYLVRKAGPLSTPWPVVLNHLYFPIPKNSLLRAWEFAGPIVAREPGDIETRRGQATAAGRPGTSPGGPQKPG